MPHPADDFQAMLDHAYSWMATNCSGPGWTPPIGIAVAQDGTCSSFGLTNPSSIFYDCVQALLFTLRHGAQSGAYRAAGYCGPDRFMLPTDRHNHYALHVHLEHRQGDVADFALALDEPVPEPLLYEDWIRVEGDRTIFPDS